jgi:hypothetical protein
MPPEWLKSSLHRPRNPSRSHGDASGEHGDSTAQFHIRAMA